MYLSATQVAALGRIHEDAQQLLWVAPEEGSVCQYTTRAVGVVIYAPDAMGARYVVG